MNRREYLGGLAGLGAFSVAGVDLSSATGIDSSHPGPPRFLYADESLQDPLNNTGKDRTALAPRVPDPERDPSNYPPVAFNWHVADRPAGSSARLRYNVSSGTRVEYDAGRRNVAEFVPDEPGVYTVELEAPGTTYGQTIRVFPAPTGDGGRPRCQLSGTFDADAETFVLDAETKAAPDADRSDAEIDAEFYPDDRGDLSRENISVEGTTARVPVDRLDGPTRVHAVGVGDRHSVADVAVLDPEAETVTLPNRSPEWIKNATVYEIFTRSFGSGPGEADFAFLESKVEYLDELGVDAVWLTPILPAYTHRHPDEPGGPHGYDIENFFGTAGALGTLEQFQSFVDSCHDHDIKVLFDLVANHHGETHPFARAAVDENSKYYDWYKRDASGYLDDYYGWNLRILNYENVALREHMLAAVDFWSDIVDGFRCDVAWGVQHSFWKEVRTLVKAKDPEFLMLDETIPYDADFDESEFDMHFDTTLNWFLREIGQGNEPVGTLFRTFEDRKIGGFPDHSVFLQYIENHDMRRYLDLSDPHSQRVAAAATFTLPGVPMLYYGQERRLTNFASPRIDEKGHFRAFMNWENYDEAHLEFYRSLVAARDSIPALDHDATLERMKAEDGVAVFARDASGQPHVFGGPQRVVVVLNFDGGPTEVTLGDAIGTTDLLTDSDVGVDADTGGTTVAVDDVAILADTSVPDQPEPMPEPDLPGTLDIDQLHGGDYADPETIRDLFEAFLG